MVSEAKDRARLHVAMRAGLAACAAGTALVLGGCSQKIIQITSEPSGAIVTLNDVELGRTPLETEFTYYGDYDVRLRLAGYEPLRTKQTAWTPIYERVPLDLVSSAFPYEHVVKWHFKLEPTRESTEQKDQFENGLITRAKDLRGQVDEPAPAAPPAQPPPTPENAGPASPPGNTVETKPPSPPPA